MGQGISATNTMHFKPAQDCKDLRKAKKNTEQAIGTAGRQGEARVGECVLTWEAYKQTGAGRLL
jgi:hypothetical protein